MSHEDTISSLTTYAPAGQEFNAEELLAWYVAMGVDETIEDIPIDHFHAAPNPQTIGPQTIGRTNVSTAVSEQNNSRGRRQFKVKEGSNQNIQKSPPNNVIAQPVQSTDGAGEQAAIAALASVTNLEDLKAALSAFDGGVIKRSAKNTVFARGPVNAPLMVIGNSPEAEDDKQGLPFLDVSGVMLDKILLAANFDTARDTYLTNLIPWRLLGNKTPAPTTIAMCLPFLQKHIQLLQPKAVLVLGGVAAKALLGEGESISRIRGRWHTLEIDGFKVQMIATYHPSHLLSKPHMKGHVWRDVLKLKEYLLS